MKITREYKVIEDHDVIVCGGGPAGVAAAVSAARKGAKTLLIEQGGCLGGLWTRGLLTWLIDTEGKDGLLNEVLSLLESTADGKRLETPKRFTADTEKTKLLLEALCRQAGVQVLYHTFLCDAVVENGRITHALTQSKDGPVAYGATYFIDTTGDGDLGYLSGASFDLGNREGKTQPMSLICQLGGIAAEDIAPFDSRKSKNTKPNMLKEMEKAGITPSYRAPLLAVLSEEYQTYAFMVNHQYGCGLNAADISQSTMDARKELHTIVDGLRSLGGIWENVHITATADAIGIREGRRIRGLNTVTEEDVLSGRQFADSICTVNFRTDVHNLKPGETGDPYGNKHPPYTIPLGSLISRDRTNLLMGGRCISGDFIAHSSYRVAGPAFRTGEVAGYLAAWCVATGAAPGDVTDPAVLF